MQLNIHTSLTRHYIHVAILYAGKMGIFLRERANATTLRVRYSSGKTTCESRVLDILPFLSLMRPSIFTEALDFVDAASEDRDATSDFILKACNCLATSSIGSSPSSAGMNFWGIFRVGFQFLTSSRSRRYAERDCASQVSSLSWHSRINSCMVEAPI